MCFTAINFLWCIYLSEEGKGQDGKGWEGKGRNGKRRVKGKGKGKKKEKGKLFSIKIPLSVRGKDVLKSDDL